MPAGFGIQHFHICKGDRSEPGHRETQSQACLSCQPSLISSCLSAAKVRRRRRREGEKAAKEGIRSSFDSFSPSFFRLFVNPAAPQNAAGSFRTCDLTILRSLWVETGTKPTLSIFQVSQSTGAASRDTAQVPG